jgi:hydrogenase maturation protease
VRDALPPPRGGASLRVVGFGNRWRRDDAVGLEVAARLRAELSDDVEVLEREGEPTGLISEWGPEDEVWLVDAVSSGAAPGTVHRIDASERELPAAIFRASTHHLGVPEAVEVARALGRFPARLVVYGIEGANFEAGRGLTPEVEGALEQVVAALRVEVMTEPPHKVEAGE